MKRNIVSIILLLLVINNSLSAKNISLEGNSAMSEYGIVEHLKQDTIPDDSLSTNGEKSISQTASTLLDAEGNAIDTTIVKLPNTYAWRIDTRFGDRTLAPMDTVRETFYRSILVEGQGIAMNYLGNIGGPVQHVEFFKRGETSQFPFADDLRAWRRSPDKQLFLNTKIPYSNVHYQAGGGKQVAENHFKAEISSNFGKRFNAGFNFDYIYARGFYQSLFNKQTSYDINASYIGDKYKAHLFAGNNNLNMSDNGGIMDDRYITSPDATGLEKIRGNSKDIPVVFEDGIKNKLRGRHIFLTQSYDLGRDKELVQIDDTTSTWRRKENYIAPASIIFTTHYQDQRRTLKGSETNRRDIHRLDSIYQPNIMLEDGETGTLYSDAMNDYMSHYTFRNTLAFRMNEGFRSWTKFGLTAFVENEMRRFLLPNARQQYLSDRVSENVWYVGGKLSKNQGKHFKFDVNVLKGLNTNELNLEGNITTTFNLFGKEFGVKAKAYVKNEVPKFFQEHFRFRNWVLDENFSDTKRVYGGGEITFPKLSFSQTTVSGGYENISDLIYWGEDRKVTQSSENVNVFALKLDQKFKFGILHIDLQGLFQKSTEESVIPLPLWTAYANIYLKTMVSKVLTFQLGVDSYMHAKYYTPGYDPIQMQFYNQREVEIGEFPHTNVYINLHLKYTRIFLMMYNVAEKFGSRQSFTTLHHPVNPMMFRWGLSWRFNN